MGGGAWPFLVSGVICLVNSDNERDPGHLTSLVHFYVDLCFLEEPCGINTTRKWGYNRSVMPLDVLGRTRATLGATV